MSLPEARLPRPDRRRGAVRPKCASLLSELGLGLRTKSAASKPTDAS